MGTTMKPENGDARCSHSRLLSVFAIGAILGCILFCVVYGIKILNPSYDDWLYNGGDNTQHYLGWLFYRQSPWHFPIGLTDGLTSEGAVSCMYTDSIPLFAVFFKILSPLLPETFQYFGMWGMFCMALMGGIGALIVHRFCRSIVFSAVAGMFFSLSPTVMHRMFRHDSLSAQWLILWGICLFVYQQHGWKHQWTPVILWALGGMLCASIHMYLIPMYYMTMLGYLFVDLFQNRNWKRPVAVFFVTTACALLTMWLLGVFYGEGDYQAGGLGLYSANYNTMFNPMGFSKFLKDLSVATTGQREGFGYLGLGMIVGGVLMLISFFVQCEKHLHTRGAVGAFLRQHGVRCLAVVLVMLLAAVFAASPVGTCNDKVIYELTLPRTVDSFLSIFRASGRFIWVTNYALYTLIFAAVSKIEFKKAACASLVLCFAVQFVDLRPYTAEQHSRFAVDSVYESPLADEQWEVLAEDATEIVFAPLPSGYLAYRELYMSFAAFAYEHELTLSSFYVARANYENLRAYADAQLAMLENGAGRDDVIYVFFEEEALPEENDTLDVYILDGFYVAVTE